MTDKESRAFGVCMRCRGPRTLVKRKDGTTWRSLFWCASCATTAHSGNSRVDVGPAALTTLPVVEYGTNACDLCDRSVPLVGMTPGRDGKDWGLCWSCWAPAPKPIVTPKPTRPRAAAPAPRGGLL